jgi:dUTP pyrophosphatase
MTALTDFITKFKSETQHQQVMHISLFCDDSDPTLKNMYKTAADAHNKKLLEDPHFYDAGFDLFLPKKEDPYGPGTAFYGKHWESAGPPINKVDFKVKCCAKMYELQTASFCYTPFYTYARSSISKTPLRLANNQGIIDAGYRGSLIGMFDCIYEENNDNNKPKEFDYYLEPYSRILQICGPGLVPIFVEIVEKLEDLGPNTSRGEGGIGSTCK